MFNHFPTKEELFFDGRTPWVHGPAAAVRSRPAHVAPLTALRRYLVDLVHSRVGTRGEDERRRYLTVLEGSEALILRERGLVRETEELLAAALVEAWHGEGTPDEVRTAAQLTAATWTATIRVIIIDRRVSDTTGTDPLETAAELGDLTDAVLRRLEACLAPGEASAPPSTPPSPAETSPASAQANAGSSAATEPALTSGSRISSTMHSTVSTSIEPSPVAV